MPQNFPLESLSLTRGSAVPLHRQLYEGLCRLIQERALAAGSGLPSTRSLAVDMAIARNTVVAAYDQLAAEGYIIARQGARPTVVDLPITPLGEGRAKPLMPGRKLSKRGELMIRQPVHHGAPGQLAFHPGMPDPNSFPFSTWGRLIARHARFARSALFGTYHVTGHPDLRRTIAGFLKASRGVRCDPEQIVITTGAQAALDLLARLLLDRGDAVWMEEPGYYGAQAAFAAAGAELWPLFVGETGWNLDEAPGDAPRLIYVTPSSQHPMGATMPMDQRLRLLQIAEARDAWVIEDDFDGEYRFRGQPIPAMQGADRTQRVIYVGTFAKMLFPALRLGFMVLPGTLAEGAARAISITGQFAPLILQAALADFIGEGHMARHLRRTRRLYAARRETFQGLCRTALSEWLHIVPGDSGIQMVGLLAEGLDDHVMAAEARARGMNISPLSMQYRHGSPSQGLVLGYAGANEAMMRKGIAALQEARRTAMAGGMCRFCMEEQDTSLLEHPF